MIRETQTYLATTTTRSGKPTKSKQHERIPSVKWKIKGPFCWWSNMTILSQPAEATTTTHSWWHSVGTIECGVFDKWSGCLRKGNSIRMKGEKNCRRISTLWRSSCPISASNGTREWDERLGKTFFTFNWNREMKVQQLVLRFVFHLVPLCQSV